MTTSPPQSGTTTTPCEAPESEARPEPRQPSMPRTERPRYYAVPDPLDPAKVSYWYEFKNALKPWPPRRNKWGRLYVSDVPAGVDQLEYQVEHFRKVRAARAEVKATIDADPYLAALRFARFAFRCCCCGRALTDKRSKVYAIGPDCRAGASPEFLSAMVARTSVAVGAAQETLDLGIEGDR